MRQLAWAIALATLVLLPCSAGAQQTDLNALLKLSQQHRQRGDLAAAETAARNLDQAVSDRFGSDSPARVIALANLARILRAQRKYVDAESLYSRCLTILEKSRGPTHPDLIGPLVGLGNVYLDQEKYGPAEARFERALAIGEKAPGSNQAHVADAFIGLAASYRSQKKYGAAEERYRSALATMEKLRDGSEVARAQLLQDLGAVYRAQRKYNEAEESYRRALAINEKLYGAASPGVILLQDLAGVTMTLGKLGEAERLSQRALAGLKSAFGPDHEYLAGTLGQLAQIYNAQGRYREAERAYRQVLAIVEKKVGPDDTSVGELLVRLGHVYQAQGRYGEAEIAYRRALTNFQRFSAVYEKEVADALGGLGASYFDQGRYGEAEDAVQRALAIKERRLWPGHPDVAALLDSLANIHLRQGKYEEAERLYRRSLAIKESSQGILPAEIAASLTNLANAFQLQRKYRTAEEYYRRALSIQEQAFGDRHPRVAGTVLNLAILYVNERRFDEAQPLYERALAIQTGSLPAGHPTIALSLTGLAHVYSARGDFAAAEKNFQRGIAMQTATLGVQNPNVALAFSQFSDFYRSYDRPQQALVFSRQAVQAVMAHAALDRPVASGSGPGGLVVQRAELFLRHVANLAAAAPQEDREAFEMSQWALHSTAAGAIQQAGQRAASGDKALEALVREEQDLASRLEDGNKELLASISAAKFDRSQLLRKQLGDADRRRSEIRATIGQQFPGYAALTGPQPVSIDDAQALLSADEAMVAFLTGADESYVFALTRERRDWRKIPIGASQLTEKVAAFRSGLDIGKLGGDAAAGKAGLFDLARAHELYRALLGDVEALIGDKRRLIVVPSGALTALPFHLLVTAPPARAVPERFDGYRDAAWLVRRQAVNVLPSVGSLRVLRAATHGLRAGKPMIGFGDPLFNPDGDITGDQPAARSTSRTVGGAAYSDFWQGANIDRDKLARALPQLPDSADELKSVAKSLGAETSDIHLGRDASESAVKRLPLADYRVVYFATHGLVAGDVKGLGEPSLVLSIPKLATAIDDGLLTASEVAQLKLNADWVVLSACNTVAGDRPGAEALSGLARAFFYAGARALLVTHWTVESQAATRLATATFAHLNRQPDLSRAEALRRAMLEYLNDPSAPENAYPALWGPFALIGEGGAL